MKNEMTHEQFVHKVRTLVLANAKLEPEDRETLANVKLVYGAGTGGVRGKTFFQAWSAASDPTTRCPLIEIAACSEESPTQLAGTTIHELAHALAGSGAGHSKEWKEACHTLGLRRAMAAGQFYKLINFHPAIRAAIVEVTPKDGTPAFSPFIGVPGLPLSLRPCSAGIGTRGGKSRGTGSGSRLRLYVCDCPTPVKVRVASDIFAAHCDNCGAAFHQPQEVGAAPTGILNIVASLMAGTEVPA